MKALFLFAVGLALAGCSASAPMRVVSWRAPEFSAERVAKAGTVCVVAKESPNQAVVASHEEALVRTGAEALGAKRFHVVAAPAGAAYGFQFAVSQTTRPSVNETFNRNDLFSEPIYFRRLVGQFCALKADGTPEKLLWQGEARATGFRFDEQTDGELMRGLLEKFPQ